MDITKKYVLNPWDDFDIHWLKCKEELERAAWNCKGMFSGFTPPFPPDLIRNELHKSLLKWQEEQMYELMGVPKEYMNASN